MNLLFSNSANAEVVANHIIGVNKNLKIDYSSIINFPFDTTSVNTGGHKGDAVRLQEKLNQANILWLP